jgi:hypothetical protein
MVGCRADVRAADPAYDLGGRQSAAGANRVKRPIPPPHIWQQIMLQLAQANPAYTVPARRW